MTLKKSYSDFIDIVNSRKLEIQILTERQDYIHLVTKDGIVFYECFLFKSDLSSLNNFDSVYRPTAKVKFSTTEASIEWDELVTTFPALNQDLFTYKIRGQTFQTVLVTYESAAKKQILSVVKTRI